jgi:hypothetical protein
MKQRITEELLTVGLGELHFEQRGSYKRELIRAFKAVRGSEISQRFFREIRQTDVVQKEFSV